MEEIFDVEVAKVNIMNVVGKKKRMGRYVGMTAASKKAIDVYKRQGSGRELCRSSGFIGIRWAEPGSAGGKPAESGNTAAWGGAFAGIYAGNGGAAGNAGIPTDAGLARDGSIQGNG